MSEELERLDDICKILWEEKENWKFEIEDYLVDLSFIYDKCVKLINLGKLTNYSVEEITNQIQKLMKGLEYRDNMFIADVLFGETRKVLQLIEVGDK